MVILDKIINDLKSRLPISKKGGSPEQGDDSLISENNELDHEEKTDVIEASGSTEITDFTEGPEDSKESSEDKSLINKIKKRIKLIKLNKATSAEEDSNNPQSDQEKKKKLIFQIVIAVGVIFFLASDYIFPEKNNETEKSKITKSSKADVKDEVENKIKPEVSEKIPSETAQSKGEVLESQNVEITSSDNGNVENGSIESVDLTKEILPDSSNVPDSASLAPTDNSPQTSDSAIQDTSLDTLKNDSVNSSDILSNQNSQGNDAAKDDVLTNEVPGGTSLDTSDQISDSPTDDKAQSDSADKFTQDILQDLEKQVKESKREEILKEYVSPPNYEYVGRGLVYNCLGKHWACVDAPSYKSCEDNFSSVKYLKKKIECHPYNVYETIRNCEDMQNRVISSSTKTNFCND